MTMQAQYSEIIDRTKVFLETGELSQERLAKSVGISGGALSSFLAGTYKGQNDTVAEKLKATLDAADNRKKAMTTVKEPELVETNVMQQMYAGLEYARDRNDILVMYGAPGIGKTVSLEKWVQENPASIFFTASPSTAGKKAIMEEILEKLGKKVQGHGNRLEKAIISALRGTNRPIVIDEAHFMTLEALETLRTIYDATRCPVILVGNTLIMSIITEANKNVTGQFFSRAVRIELDKKITIDDVKAIVLQNGIELDEECLTTLHKIANKVGALRVMTKLFLFAWSSANRCKERININHILSAKSVIATDV